MLSFLESEEAIKEAEKMARMMIETGSISFPPSPSYPISMLSPTTTFAILIARPKSQDGERILRGISGSIGDFSIPGYVQPCFSLSRWHEEENRNDEEIHRLTKLIEDGDESLIERRKELTESVVATLSSLYRFRCWNGEDIPLPKGAPWGTGDCAGLRCINAALRKGWEIIALAEFQIMEDGKLSFHPPCQTRCALLLPKMLGLDFIYADEDIAVIDKEAGMLSVQGRGEDKEDSAQYRFHSLFPRSPRECACHRLDMDTSGLLVLAFTKDAKRKLSMAFESHEVEKEYIALLEGVITDDEGLIDIPIRLDVDNRPYQIEDRINGKRAITRFKRLGVEVKDGKKYTRVLFQPQTGRTHQLRVHSSLTGHPIKGDRLYGTRREGERLMLHASKITFRHPRSGERLTFSSQPPF